METSDESVVKPKQRKLLGECTFELHSVLKELIEFEGSSKEESLKFTRLQGENLVTVGRFVADFKIQKDEIEAEEYPHYMKPKQLKAIIDIDRELPKADFGLTIWRIRMCLRCAVGAHLESYGLPSLFMEAGWSKYKEDDIDSNTVIRTEIIYDNRHPMWNEELLFPSSLDNPCTYFYSL